MKDGKIEPRYRVTHKDGKPINPAHRLFILSRDTDQYAAPALAFYSQICKATHPQLSEDILRHYDVAPPEPVTLTAEERESMSIALFDAYWSGSPRTRGFRWHQSDEPELWHGLRDKFLEHLTAHGFALVRTKAVADGA